MNKKDLLNAKYQWDCKEEFDFIYIIPTRRKHESGYMQMEIIGAVYDEEESTLYRYIKLCSYSDVVDIGDSINNCIGISIDVQQENNCIRLFSHYGKLKPIFQLSACTFEVIKK